MRAMLNRLLRKEIMRDQRLRQPSKLMYHGLLSHPKSTIKGVAAAFAMSYATARRSVKELEQYDWVYSFPDRKKRLRIYVPWMPLDIETALAKEVEWLAGNVANRGEWLMKAMLDIIVDDDDVVDNARFKWTVLNPSDSPREFDRYYRKTKVAIEFQGRQHYEEVTFRDGTSNLQEQQNRDGLKALACLRRGVTMVEIPDIELSYATLVAKLEHLLPLLPVRPDRPLFQTLSTLCDDHATWAKSRRGSGGGTSSGSASERGQ